MELTTILMVYTLIFDTASKLRPEPPPQPQYMSQVEEVLPPPRLKKVEVSVIEDEG